MTEEKISLDDLYKVICDRRENPKEGSYTTALFEAGENEILKKVGEEAVEVILAASAQGDRRLVEEMADLVYHLLVLMASRKVDPEDILLELTRRRR